MAKKDLRICKKGHRYFKSSDCPVCPTCEQEQKPENGFLSTLGGPARRALENLGVRSLNQLAKFSEKDILALHGMGPSTIPKLKAYLKEKGLKFKSKK